MSDIFDEVDWIFFDRDNEREHNLYMLSDPININYAKMGIRLGLEARSKRITTLETALLETDETLESIAVEDTSIYDLTKRFLKSSQVSLVDTMMRDTRLARKARAAIKEVIESIKEKK